VVHDPSWQDTGVTTSHCAHFAQAIRPSYALMSRFSSASMWCSNCCFASWRSLISALALVRVPTFGREDLLSLSPVTPGGSTLFPVQQVTAARAALAALALEYESIAFASTVEEPSLGAVLRKERRQRQ
jgi:hypothetical protein